MAASMNEYDETRRSRAYWRIVNGFQIRVGRCFFWLNFFGIGIGRIDSRQAIRYWRRTDREWTGNPW